MKLPKYMLKEWVTRCALSLIANVVFEYSAKAGDIFICLTCLQITHAVSTVTKSWRSGTAFVQESGQADMYIFKCTCLEMFLCWMTSVFKQKKAIIKVGISKGKENTILSFRRNAQYQGSGSNRNTLAGVRNCGMSLINNWFSYCCSFQWRRGFQEIDFTSESFYKENEKENMRTSLCPIFKHELSV